MIVSIWACLRLLLILSFSTQAISQVTPSATTSPTSDSSGTVSPESYYAVIAICSIIGALLLGLLCLGVWFCCLHERGRRQVKQQKWERREQREQREQRDREHQETGGGQGDTFLEAGQFLDSEKAIHTAYHGSFYSPPSARAVYSPDRKELPSMIMFDPDRYDQAPSLTDHPAFKGDGDESGVFSRSKQDVRRKGSRKLHPEFVSKRMPARKPVGSAPSIGSRRRTHPYGEADASDSEAATMNILFERNPDYAIDQALWNWNSHPSCQDVSSNLDTHQDWYMSTSPAESTLSHRFLPDSDFEKDETDREEEAFRKRNRPPTPLKFDWGRLKELRDSFNENSIEDSASELDERGEPMVLPLSRYNDSSRTSTEMQRRSLDSREELVSGRPVQTQPELNRHRIWIWEKESNRGAAKHVAQSSKEFLAMPSCSERRLLLATPSHSTGRPRADSDPASEYMQSRQRRSRKTSQSSQFQNPRRCSPIRLEDCDKGDASHNAATGVDSRPPTQHGGTSIEPAGPVSTRSSAHTGTTADQPERRPRMPETVKPRNKGSLSEALRPRFVPDAHEWSGGELENGNTTTHPAYQDIVDDRYADPGRHGLGVKAVGEYDTTWERGYQSQSGVDDRGLDSADSDSAIQPEELSGSRPESDPHQHEDNTSSRVRRLSTSSSRSFHRLYGRRPDL